jgi:16S rRNA (guanine966-N2)-methyltransferase
MRIIAGSWRGRKLLTPADRAIRPTSDRAREALFGILQHGQPALRGVRFLDLFSGTGAVGLEAASRGAAEVWLVDDDRQALALAAANLTRLGGPANVRLVDRDATSLGPARQAFGLVFLDPPYRSGLAGPALAGLLNGWLMAGARIILELAAKEDLSLPDGYALEQERRYGAARFAFLRPAE